jgi:hypothetical protein
MPKNQLCIQVSENFCSVAELKDHDFHLIDSIEFKEKKDFQYKEILNSFFSEKVKNSEEYDEISLSWISPNAVIVPSSIFLPNEMETIYKTCFSEKKSSAELDYTRMMEHALAVIYEVPSWVKSFFIIKFPRVIIQHEYAHLIRGMMKNSFALNIQVSIFPQMMQIILVNKSELLLCNSYEINHENDILYYLSFVINQKQLQETKGKLNISIHKLSLEKSEDQIEQILKENMSKIKLFNNLSLNFDKKQSFKFQEFCV